MKGGGGTYRAVIFDLDGTLLDTLDDLTNAVNTTLTALGLPGRTRDEVRSFVGDGVAKLMERAMPVGFDPQSAADGLARFKAYYADHCREKTAPYEGIPSLLADLQKMGLHTGIVSNKFDGAVKALSKHYFGDLIEVAVGERESEGIRKKPAPDTLLMAMGSLGVSPQETLYVGDADTDIMTARGAGVACASVTWGFRDREFLLSHGATMLIDRPDELKSLLSIEEKI
ncbi:MAG: HAD family hydrolase [Ruminococcaceae bacterium]|nr:HAD family hydrolase [Oscillospiraceae bacterium]